MIAAHAASTSPTPHSKSWLPSGRDVSTSSSSGNRSLPTATQIRELARRHGVKPSKALGQNFVVDPNTVRRMVRLAEVSAADRVVEIGAGLGTLTLALAEVAESVIAVEFDRVIIPALEEVTARATNVRVIWGDGLSLDYESVLDRRPHRFVSNLPYNIATPLIVHILERVPLILDVVAMIQREVGERLASGPGSKSYGSASVVVAYFADAEILGRVPPTVFWPAPKVESVLVRLRRRPPPVDVSYDDLMKVVRPAFGQRRKTIRNTVAESLGVSPERVVLALKRSRIDPKTRPEMLSIQQFARLAQELS